MVASVKRALRITPMLNRLTCDDTDERWAASGSCHCWDGQYCTGPRGGTFCYSDSGKKSYRGK